MVFCSNINVCSDGKSDDIRSKDGDIELGCKSNTDSIRVRDQHILDAVDRLNTARGRRRKQSNQRN